MYSSLLICNPPSSKILPPPFPLYILCNLYPLYITLPPLYISSAYKFKYCANLSYLWITYVNKFFFKSIVFLKYFLRQEIPSAGQLILCCGFVFFISFECIMLCRSSLECICYEFVYFYIYTVYIYIYIY